MLDVKRILSEYKRVDDWKKINILIETNKVNKEELIAEVLKSGNSDFILWTALYVEGAPVENLRDALIETSDLDNLLSFAINATGTSVKPISDVIIASKKPELAYYYARDVHKKGVPLKKLCSIVCKSLEADLIFYFARDIVFKRNYDDCTSAVELNKFQIEMLNKLSSAILKTKNTTYISLFSRFNREGAEESLKSILENIRTGNGTISSLILYAENNPTTPMEEIESTIAKRGTIIDMINFAQKFPTAPLGHIIKALQKNGTILDKIAFIERVPSASIDILFQNLLESFADFNQMRHYLSYMATGDAPGKDLAASTLNDLHIDPYLYLSNEADKQTFARQSHPTSKTAKTHSNPLPTKNNQRAIWRKRQILLNVLRQVVLQKEQNEAQLSMPTTSEQISFVRFNITDINSSPRTK